MSVIHYIGIVICIGLFVGVEIYSMSKVKTAGDFEKGSGKAGPALVIGTLLGTMLGGQATMGSAQLGYLYGLSGIWFTLGAAIGCAILAIVYSSNLRRSRQTTIVEVLKGEYGSKVELTGSILSSVGTVISAVSNMIAATALVSVITGWSLIPSCIVAVFLECIYVVAGGVVGAGMGGVMKMGLLYMVSLLCLVTAISKAGEIGPGTAIDFRFADIFARGLGKELCSGLSLIVGVLSTQTYAQAIWSAKSDAAAKKGALLAALLCIPVGICSVVVGLFMRSGAVSQASEVYPRFLIENLPPIVAGVGLGALLITVVTGGGGLVLGVSTVITRDVIGGIMGDKLTDERRLAATRIVILICMGGVALAALMMPGAIINDVGFLSLGLRGTVLLVPLTLALFRQGKYSSKFILASMVAGPLSMIIAEVLKSPLEPLLIGLIVATIVALLGKKKTA